MNAKAVEAILEAVTVPAQLGGGIRDMGFPESFRRMWEFYLCYCEGGFLERTVGVAQMIWAGEHNRQDGAAAGEWGRPWKG